MEMDALASDSVPLLLLGATNHLSRMHPGLIRPGRLDRLVHVPLPNLKERTSILHVLRRKTTEQFQKGELSVHWDDTLDLEELAFVMEGRSGADIVEWTRRATRFAIQSGTDRIVLEHLEHALVDL